MRGDERLDWSACTAWIGSLYLWLLFLFLKKSKRKRIGIGLLHHFPHASDHVIHWAHHTFNLYQKKKIECCVNEFIFLKPFCNFRLFVDEPRIAQQYIDASLARDTNNQPNVHISICCYCWFVLWNRFVNRLLIMLHQRRQLQLRRRRLMTMQRNWIDSLKLLVEVKLIDKSMFIMIYYLFRRKRNWRQLFAAHLRHLLPVEQFFVFVSIDLVSK